MIKRLVSEGVELEEKLMYYLSAFTEGTMDPELAGKKPDKFISNLKNGILGDFSKRYIITALSSDEVMGILIGLPEEDELLHIFSLHVAPNYRSKGVGSALLSKCINDMCKNGIKDIIIDVHVDNKPAYSLYMKFDFMKMNN